jgi:hypothetical protein
MKVDMKEAAGEQADPVMHVHVCFLFALLACLIASLLHNVQ